ncbi:hypothetical protein L7F22_043303 [Adiantum nelumboides]|nr:hypothetical protein [Adiantum nelumboides]
MSVSHRDNPINGPINITTGKKILIDRGLPTEAYHYWTGVGALIGFIIIFNCLLTLALSGLPAPKRSRHTVLREKSDGVQGDEQKAKASLLTTKQRFSIHELLTEPVPSFDEDMDLNQEVSLPFKPLSISFENVQYFVDMPHGMMAHGVQEKSLQLLRGVTGSFRPGVLTALMGVSGAGKTTLMDVLAGRKTGGYIEGDIRISGYPKVQTTFARVSGYCEQTDIHSPQVTVRESLLYSSWLRLSPDISKNVRWAFVDEVMELVELDNLSEALVGLPGISGLSTEQRKRLTIAVELVANPFIIFMDEPTSGLDARAAAIVMRAVKNIVKTRRTVVCTIHQPSIDIFEAFDELLLMKRGGQVIYAGPLGRHSQNVIEYFEIPGVPKMEKTSNPATWMLEITSKNAEQRLGVDFATLYKESQLSRQNTAMVRRLSFPDSESQDLYFPTKYYQSFWGQFKILFWKQHLIYWRSPGYNLVRFSFTLMAALLFGTLFWQLGNRIKKQQDLLTIMGAMYGATLFLGINNCSTVQPTISLERYVFYRERAAGMYSAIAYALSQVAIECPYVLVQTLLYAAIVYSMMGFEWVLYKVLWFVFTMFCTFLYFTYYGMMAVAISPNHQVATIVASAFYAIFNLFSGFLMPKPNLPQWWLWYYWLCPTSWTMSGLITSQYGNRVDQIECLDASHGKILLHIRGFLNHNYGFHEDFLGHVAAVLIVLPIFFALLFAFFMKILSFQRR